MFQFVKTRKLLIQIILALIIIPFAFFGLESYTRSMRGADDVATVNGSSITQREFTEELRRQQDRFRSIFGRGADLAEFDTPEARLALLDSLIAQRLVGTAALQSNLLVSDEALREVIATTPAFQSDGRFSKSNYETLLRAQGMTSAGYEAQLRYELTAGQLVRVVAESAIPGRTVAQRLAALEEEAREVSVATVPSDAFLDKVTPQDKQARSYYEANLSAFRTAERLRAEYVVLSAADLGGSQPVTDAEVQAAYDARASQYKVAEQRRASHILLQVAPDASAADRKAARAKIEGLLAEVRKSPGRFSELAKRHSQDIGSAENGGDLGLFGRGMMVKPFEDAVFALKEGETSGVIETEYGYHIIRLTGVQGAKARPLQEVRPELVAEVRRQKGLRKFTEAAETFSNMVYEQSDSLKPVAEQFRLQIRKSDWIVKSSAATPDSLLNRKLIDALFSSDAIGNKRNTDAVEVAPNTLVAARVAEYQPSVQRPFDEVRGEIERALQRQEAAKLAHKEGAAKLEQLAKGVAAAGLTWGVARQVSRRSPQGFAPDTLRRVLAADVKKLPAYVGIERGDEGYAIFRISKIIEPAPKSDAQKQAEVARAARQAGLAQYEAFLASLRARADVSVNRENLVAKQ